MGALALRTNKAFTGNAEELSAKRKNYLALLQEDFAKKKGDNLGSGFEVSIKSCDSMVFSRTRIFESSEKRTQR